jgi:hypothetical protein
MLQRASSPKKFEVAVSTCRGRVGDHLLFSALHANAWRASVGSFIFQWKSCVEEIEMQRVEDAE